MGKDIVVKPITVNSRPSVLPIAEAIQPEPVSKTPSTAASATRLSSPRTKFIFDQTVPRSVWKIKLNLAQYVIVQLLDSSGCLMMANIRQPNKNEVLVEFSSAQAGKAVLT